MTSEKFYLISYTETQIESEGYTYAYSRTWNTLMISEALTN